MVLGVLGLVYLVRAGNIYGVILIDLSLVYGSRIHEVYRRGIGFVVGIGIARHARDSWGAKDLSLGGGNIGGFVLSGLVRGVVLVLQEHVIDIVRLCGIGFLVRISLLGGRNRSCL